MIDEEMVERLTDIYTRLLDRYGDPHWWLGETPYETRTVFLHTEVGSAFAEMLEHCGVFTRTSARRRYS